MASRGWGGRRRARALRGLASDGIGTLSPNDILTQFRLDVIFCNICSAALQCLHSTHAIMCRTPSHLSSFLRFARHWHYRWSFVRKRILLSGCPHVLAVLISDTLSPSNIIRQMADHSVHSFIADHAVQAERGGQCVHSLTHSPITRVCCRRGHPLFA